MAKFSINGRTYQAKELDFEYLVEMDKAGINVDNITGLASINLYLSYCSGMTEKQASSEISKHMINGGSLDELTQAFGEMVSESDFFRSIMGTNNEEETEEENPGEEKSKTKRKKTSATE